jgi:hypothetical protein
MAAVSGQYGKIAIASSTVTECTYWSFDRMANDQSYSSCATAGYKKRVAGVKDGSGNLKGFQDPSNAIETYFEEGDLVTLLLYYTASKYYTVPAMITKLHVEADIGEGALVPWEADFGINGAWTLPA